MRDMVCDVITSCFRSCDVGKRSRCDKIVGPDLKPAKIETKMKKKTFYTNFHQEDAFRVEFTVYECEMIREGAVTSFRSCDTYHSFTPYTIIAIRN